jgi:hypothetical protein
MHASHLEEIIESLSRDSFGQKFKNLNRAICQLVQEFGLVSFLTLAIEDKESMQSVINAVDIAIGFVPKEAQGDASTFEAARRLEAWGQLNQEIGQRYLKHDYDDPAFVKNVSLNADTE